MRRAAKLLMIVAVTVVAVPMLLLVKAMEWVSQTDA